MASDPTMWSGRTLGGSADDDEQAPVATTTSVMSVSRRAPPPSSPDRPPPGQDDPDPDRRVQLAGLLDVGAPWLYDRDRPEHGRDTERGSGRRKSRPLGASGGLVSGCGGSTAGSAG
jgi:hypothetical protein